MRFGDWDFCEKAKRAGYKIFSVPSAVSYHKRSATIKSWSAKNLYYSKRNYVRLFIKHYPIVRMVIASLVWVAYMAMDSIRLFPPTRRILLFAGIARTHIPPEKLSRLFTALLKSIWWNLENLGNHLKARRVIQLIEPS